MLPILFVLITVGLWWWAREDYLSVAQQENGLVVWTDYTPIPLEVAGALNVPVATFGYPLYRLVHEVTSRWELIALLLGVAVQWGYVGWVLDSRNASAPAKSRLRGALGVAGLIYGVFVLLVSIPMYHVGVIYKGAAVVWAIFICWHFLSFLRRPSSGQQ